MEFGLKTNGTLYKVLGMNTLKIVTRKQSSGKIPKIKLYTRKTFIVIKIILQIP